MLVEAASQGLACLSTPVSGIVELIRDGENGVLVEPDDPDALAGAMTALITDPAARDRLGQEARSACARSSTIVARSAR